MKESKQTYRALKAAHKEKMRLWRESKMRSGWVAIYMFVPSELAEKVNRLKRDYRIEHL